MIRRKEATVLRRDRQHTALIFDLDGTLVDTADDLAASVNHVLTRQGLKEIDPFKVRHLVGHGAKRMLAEGYTLSAEREPTPDELEAGLSAFLVHYEANIAVHSRPFEGAIDLIHDHRSRAGAVAICTNKREFLARKLLSALGLAPLFQAVIGADSTTAAKPDPAPVLKCLELTEARTGIFIGDSDTDIRAAQAAQIPCYVAVSGYGPTTMIGEAKGQFSHYSQLAALLDGQVKA